MPVLLAGREPDHITRPDLLNRAAFALNPATVRCDHKCSAGELWARIQAFDLGGNPAPFFKAQRDPYFPYLSATEGSTYLDLAVEFSGYLYVLSRSGNPPVFRLDIYHPAPAGSQPICTTRGMNASRLNVDFWRNVYTLNYEVLKLPSGQIPARTEPSVSFWAPPPPTL